MKIAVSAKSFCKNDLLRSELLSQFPNSVFLESEKNLNQSNLKKLYQNASGIIIGTEILDEKLLSQFPDLKMISKYGVGIDNVDLKVLNQLGIAFGYTPGVNSLCVAELTLGLMLGLAHNIFSKGIPLKSGYWDKNGGIQLSAKKVGIIGCGNIGYKLLQLLQPFNCQILVNDLENRQSLINPFNARQTSKEEIFKTCQFITLHTPLTEQTFHLINTKTLNQMNQNCYLINTARGRLIDQPALKEALLNNIIAGAALDVFELEPPHDLEFLGLPQLMTTPHIGGNAIEAQLSMGRSAIDHLVRYFKI